MIHFTGSSDPLDPTGKAPVRLHIKCEFCNEEATLESKLSGIRVCEYCVNDVIDQDEKDYPGDQGNHKIEDFEELEPEYEED